MRTSWTRPRSVPFSSTTVRSSSSLRRIVGSRKTADHVVTHPFLEAAAFEVVAVPADLDRAADVDHNTDGYACRAVERGVQSAVELARPVRDAAADAVG